MLVPSVPLWRIPKQHAEHWACTFSFLMLFFPAASEKCKMWWVSVPRAQLIVNDVHQLWMWHVGPPFLLLPPPVSYSKWMKRTSKKLCLLSCRYVIKHFIFYNIRNIIEMKTLKDCLHWESQYRHGQVKLSLEWREGFWKRCLQQSHRSSWGAFISPPSGQPLKHIPFFPYLSVPGIQNFLGNKHSV